MNDADRVLEWLYARRGGYVAAEELARRCNLKVTALGSAVQELLRAGQPIEFAPSQGYRLGGSPALNAALLEQGLGTCRLGRNIICFDEVASTNDVAFDSSRQDDADGLVVTADRQRSGRGRLGRTWISPPGVNVLMSVLLLDRSDRLPLEAVTIATGLAVAEGCEAVCPVACELKWPNDVLVDARKVAGVLVEVRPRPAGGKGKAIVVGIGLNANAAPPADQVRRPVTCLADQAGHEVDRIALTQAVLRRLDAWLEAITERRIESLHDAWVSRCGMINERLAIQSGGRLYRGRVLDVSPLEGLVLAVDDGGTAHLSAQASTVMD